MTHSPQSISSPHHAVPSAAQPVTRPMSEATNGLASSVNLSSIQSLVDLLVELPLPSESPAVVSSASRLISEEEISALQPAVSSMDQQQSLSQHLAAAMTTAKQQLNQLNIAFKQKRSATSSEAHRNRDSNLTSFSRNHNENAYMLTALRQMDALSADAAVPPVAPEDQMQQSQSRSQNQYWSPWSGSDSGVSATAQAPPQSPFVASPSYAMRGTPSQTTAIANDNSNSSSSFSADPVTPSAMVTPPSHQPLYHQPQVYNQQEQFQQPLAYEQQPQTDAVSAATTVMQQQPQQVNHYQESEPVVLLEHSEVMEKALQDYYASNGVKNACP